MVNGQSIRSTVHSDLISDELLSYMQGIGCNELGKHTIFNEHLVPNSDEEEKGAIKDQNGLCR